MVEYDSHETCDMYSTLSVPLRDQQQFRLSKTNEIKDYFAVEIKERELMRKRLIYCFLFDYFDKSFIVLSVTTGSISIASFELLLEDLKEWQCKF